MNTALIMLSILGVVCVVIAISVHYKNEDNGYFILGCGIGIIVSIMIITPIHALSIHSIDVYRGKTTLEITYKDSIPIDSVVVYKNK